MGRWRGRRKDEGESCFWSIHVLWNVSLLFTCEFKVGVSKALQSLASEVQKCIHTIFERERERERKLSLDKDTPTPSGSDQTSSLCNPTDEQPPAESQPPSTDYHSLIEMKDKFT